MRWPGVQQSLLTSGSSEDACAQSTEAQKLLRSYDHFSGVLAQPGIAGLRGQYTRPPPQQLQPSRGATHEGPLGRPLCPAPARAAAEPAPLFALATDGRDAGFAQLVNRLARGRVEFVPP